MPVACFPAVGESPIFPDASQRDVGGNIAHNSNILHPSGVHFARWMMGLERRIQKTCQWYVQRVKKASQSLPPAGGKENENIFICDMCVDKNTSQAVSVRVGRRRRTRSAGGRLQSLCQKRALPFFDSLNLPVIAN